jgi:glucosamine-6-phosphate deaminase
MHLLRFDSDAAWVGGVSALWRDRLRTSRTLSICLPTGLTPLPVYAEMVRSVRARHASFARTTLFALDEFGGLAADDPGRTKHTLRRELLDLVDVPEDACHFLDPDASDVDAHCRRYDQAIAHGFDLVLLGIGANGHLGMNEPASAEDSPTRRVELHGDTIQASARYFSHRNLPRWGLTVGLKAILAANEVWLLATGSAKAEIIRRTLEGPIGPANPASLLRRHPNCWLFVNAEAAALVCRANGD